MRWLLILLGLVLILFGLLTVLIPIPTGILSLVAGATVLAAVSPTFRKFFKWLRRKIKPLDAVMDKAEDVLPEELAKPLKRTDPDPEAEEDTAQPNDADAVSAANRPLQRHPTPYRRDQLTFLN